MPRIAFLTLSSSLLTCESWAFVFNVVVVPRNPELYLREGINNRLSRIYKFWCPGLTLGREAPFSSNERFRDRTLKLAHQRSAGAISTDDHNDAFG